MTWNELTANWRALEAQTTKSREVVVVGWDGKSQPIRRYADELHLPDHLRAVVKAEDRPN